MKTWRNTTKESLAEEQFLKKLLRNIINNFIGIFQVFFSHKIIEKKTKLQIKQGLLEDFLQKSSREFLKKS